MNNKNLIYISDSSDEDKKDIQFIKKNNIKKIQNGACIICEKNYIQVLFHPCKHASICIDCYKKLTEPIKCPYCGAFKTKTDLFILA